MNRKRKRNKAIVFAFVLITACSVCLIYAKYMKEVAINTALGTTNVARYHLYLEGDSAVSIPLSNLNPGSTESIPFVVSNGKDEDGVVTQSEVDLLYRIVIITTNHLPITYTIRDSEGNALAAPNVENSLMPYSNTGKRITFLKDRNGEELVFKKDTIVNKNYSVEIEWPINQNDFKYTKEVEQIYIAVEAVQAQPE